MRVLTLMREQKKTPLWVTSLSTFQLRGFKKETLTPFLHFNFKKKLFFCVYALPQVRDSVQQ